MPAANSWERYTNAIRGPGFAGPSGYLAFPSSEQYPYGRTTASQYPGNRLPADSAVAARYPTASTAAGKSGATSLFQPISVVKNPAGNAALEGVLKQFNDWSGDYQGLAGLTKSATSGLPGAAADYENRYNTFQQGLDPSGYIASLRREDTGQSANLDALRAQNAGLVSRYEGANTQYEQRGKEALDAELANARGFRTEDLPAIDAATRDLATNYASRYAMARGGGFGSDIPAITAREYSRAILPYYLQSRQLEGAALGRYAPFYGDVANRQTSGIASFEQPLAQNEYGQAQALSQGRKATDNEAYQATQIASQRGLSAAIDHLIKQSIAPEEAARILSIPMSVIRDRLSVLQGYGQTVPLFRDEAINYTPGAQAAYPRYPAPAYPNYNYPQPGQRYPLASPTAGTGSTNTRSKADEAYKQQTGYYPEQDPNFSRYAYGQIVQPSQPESAPAPYMPDRPGYNSWSDYAGG